jgi:hypothetical protein
MFRSPLNCTIALALFCAGLAGCGARGTPVGGTAPPDSGPVVLVMTDTPPTTVSILAAVVTVTGATLSPGNVSLLTTPTTLEVTRLQTDVAYLSKTNVKAGNYTSLALTFANLSLTIENDTTSAIVSGGITCNVGAICTIPPTTPSTLSTTITLPTFTISTGVGAGLLVDVNLENLLSPMLGADFKAGTTVAEFTPAGSGAPLVGAEDVVGQVASIDTVHNTFSFAAQSSLPTPSLPALTVDNTSTFYNFPSGTCATPSILCLIDGQIVSVDISIRADGTPVARNVIFEDNNSNKTEIEGIITSTNVGSQQFTIVSLAESAAFGGPVFGGTSTGLVVGEQATVTYNTPAAPTTFDVDFTHADNMQLDTTCCLFRAPSDLSVGQQVQVRSIINTPGTSITTDRVRLRSSRVTATVAPQPPDLVLSNLPSIFSGHGVTQIQAHTFTPGTIFSDHNNLTNISLIPPSSLVSVRGPLFNVSGARTMVATKVVLKP